MPPSRAFPSHAASPLRAPQELLAQIVPKQAELKADSTARAGRRGKQDALLELYDALLVEDNDALEILKQELRPTSGRDGGKGGASSGARAADPTQLLLLQRYFALRKLRHTVRRHLLMLAQLRDRVAAGGAAGAAGERKGTTAEDVSRVYTVVLQHLGETSALLNAAEDAADIEQTDLASLSAKAFRTYYLASSCMLAGKWAHARALLERTAEYLGEADALTQTMSANAVRAARASRCHTRRLPPHPRPDARSTAMRLTPHAAVASASASRRLPWRTRSQRRSALRR
jgi:hypothetical protein